MIILINKIDKIQVIESTIYWISYYLNHFSILIWGIPIITILLYYVGIMIFIIFSLIFDIILFVSVLTFIITCSPWLCLYFKFSKKEKDGITVTISLNEECAICSICLEDFSIN